MSDTPTWRERFRTLHEHHGRKLDLLFFAGGFVFDVWAASAGVDHALVMIQQVLYLSLIGGILYLDLVRQAQSGALPMPTWIERLWRYRSLVLHFCLGTLMNLYSIFFLMSASLSSSIVFVALLLTAVILNELQAVRRRGIDVKIALYVLCTFCLWSLIIPIVLHHVGGLTFVLSCLATLGVIALLYDRLRRRLDRGMVRRRVVMPGLAVVGLLVLLYQGGLIPPVPVAAKTLGVYHRVERSGDQFTLYREPARWRFWQSDDRLFVAEPGDVVHVFFAIYSPTDFADTVFVRWSVHDRTAGWQDSDRIPIRITGGRAGGFRGTATKQNYVDGRWRVRLETQDGREIARRHFTISSGPVNPSRVFVVETY